MNRAEEKNIGIIKKAKEFLPDGGYSEKELNLAFSMFINGYQQAEKDLALTLEDIKLLHDISSEVWRVLLDDCIINDKEYSDEEYYQEVLKRFNERKNR